MCMWHRNVLHTINNFTYDRLWHTARCREYLEWFSTLTPSIDFRMLLLRGVYISGRWMRLINFRNVLISKYKRTDVYGRRRGRRAERRKRDDWLSKIDSNTMNGLLSRHASVLFAALSPALLQHHSYHLPSCALRCPSVDHGSARIFSLSTLDPYFLVFSTAGKKLSSETMCNP